jgi:ActR/RegA family two-component response regulator
MTITFPKIGMDDVVIFEDDLEDLSKLVHEFEGRGLTAHSAKTVDDVIELQAQGAKCFVLDGKYEDDEQAGPKALRRLKQADPHCFVAFVTGRPSYYSDQKRAADTFLEKQGDPHWLADTIYRSMRETELKRDPDHAAFCSLMADPAWACQNKDKYVGIVDGQVVALDDDRVRVVTVLESYPEETAKYYNRVEPSPKAVSIDTPFRRP